MKIRIFVLLFSLLSSITFGHKFHVTINGGTQRPLDGTTWNKAFSLNQITASTVWTNYIIPAISHSDNVYICFDGGANSNEVGNYSVTFNGEDFPSGMYLYVLKSIGYCSIKKMILLK